MIVEPEDNQHCRDDVSDVGLLTEITEVDMSLDSEGNLSAYCFI